MHVVNASSAFDVSFRHLSRLAPVPLALFSSRSREQSRERLHTVGQALSLAVQGLAFALAIWLLLALPVFLFAR